MVWLLSAPQFWYGFVACAAVVFLTLLPAALFPRRTVIVYSLPDRAPVPLSDPFYKPGVANQVPPRPTDTHCANTGASPGKRTHG